MALALKSERLKARAVLAWQLPIQVDGAPGASKITGIDPALLEACLAEGVIPVVAGYQGVGPDGRLAPLGRGGPDLSAAAIAAAIGAECDIYTDVDGVFTTDPRIAEDARRVARISHEEMLELAAQGAKVLQTRSVEYAKAKGVTLRVKSSFLPAGESGGTEVVPAGALAERRVVSGVAYARDQARLSLHGLPDVAAAPAAVLAAMAGADAHVDMIVQSRARDGGVNLEFSVERRDLGRATAALEALDGLGGARIAHETDLAKVSVVGTGLRGRADVARTLYAVLQAEGIAARMVATSEIKISVLVDSELLERAVRALHNAYGLHQA
jgi:aspartate kinase